jgi:MFS family permease
MAIKDNEIGVHSPLVPNQRPIKSLDAVLNEIPFSYFHIRLTIMCGLAFMADAMEVGLLAFISDCAGVEWGLSSSQKAAIVSVVFAGELLGSFFWAKIADDFGRRTTFLVVSGIISAGGVCSAIAPSYFWLVFLQAIVGFGIGGLIVPFDLLAEFLPTESRGRSLLYVNYFWTFGSLFVNGCAWGILGSDGWRMLTMVTAIPVIVASVLCIIFLPESPRWLLLEGRREEAEDALIAAAAVNGITLEPFQLECSVAEGADADGSLEPEKDEGGKYIDLIMQPDLRATTLPISFIWLVFGFTYYGLILFVAAIYETADDDGTCSFDYQDMFINSSAELVGLCIAVYVIDSLGRSKTQSVFYAVAGATVVCLGPLRQNLAILLVGFAARAAICGASVSKCMSASPMISLVNVLWPCNEFVRLASQIFCITD